MGGEIVAAMNQFQRSAKCIAEALTVASSKCIDLQRCPLSVYSRGRGVACAAMTDMHASGLRIGTSGCIAPTIGMFRTCELTPSLSAS